MSLIPYSLSKKRPHFAGHLCVFDVKTYCKGLQFYFHWPSMKTQAHTAHICSPLQPFASCLHLSFSLQVPPQQSVFRVTFCRNVCLVWRLLFKLESCSIFTRKWEFNKDLSATMTMILLSILCAYLFMLVQINE